LFIESFSLTHWSDLLLIRISDVCSILNQELTNVNSAWLDAIIQWSLTTFINYIWQCSIL
jgi:hypothetical protein